jgi:hypothetical protein
MSADPKPRHCCRLSWIPCPVVPAQILNDKRGGSSDGSERDAGKAAEGSISQGNCATGKNGRLHFRSVYIETGLSP